MNELILLCTKGVNFTFKTNSVAMGSPLTLVLSRMFMIELENNLIQTLSEHLACWKIHVDETIYFIKNDSFDYVISVLNSFNLSIQFTYETENNNSISFLNIELLHIGENIENMMPENKHCFCHMLVKIDAHL